MKMKKSVLVLMSVLLLTGCGAAVSESVQTDSDNVNISRSDIELDGENRMESDEEYLPETQNGLTAEESLEVTPKLSLTETSVIPPESMSEAESSTALENVSETDIKPRNFDAAGAMEVEQIDEGIKVVFYQFPETIEDMEALIALYPQTDPSNVGAYFLAALVKYVDSSESGLSMIDLLRGPRPHDRDG